MAEFVCPNCGNRQLRDLNGKVISSVKALDVHGKYACSECGAELEHEHLKELIAAAVQEYTLSTQLLQQARNAKKSGDYETASENYQQLLNIDPNNWEAAFYSVCCNSWGCNVGGIDNACTAVKLCLGDVFDKLETLPKAQKQTAVKLVVSDAGLFAVEKFDAAVRYHASLNASVMTQHNSALKSQLISALNVVIACSSLVMERFGNDSEIAPLVELPANVALQMQSRQTFVSVVLEPETSRTLLEWIGRYNPSYVEEYKKKQNRSMASGTIFLIVLGAIFLALGLLLEGVFAKWFCIPMAAFCLLVGIFRIIVQAANKKLNG